ncbi:hypothetical protein [Streptomyces sp. PTD5-9]|uniref:hypothetical protein n=1 Tax=Streptomyces sp. PTD5-9 TaxID=3120150 RepID=UPI003008435B
MRDRIRATAALAAPPSSDADEALRRARTALDAPTRDLMDRIAEKLATTNPDMSMREVTRLAYASRYATEQHGLGTARTTAALQLLLRHMPRTDDGRAITRGDYARLLRAKAGHTTAPEAQRRVHDGRVVLGRDRHAARAQDLRDYESAEALRRAHSNRCPGLG